MKNKLLSEILSVSLILSILPSNVMMNAFAETSKNTINSELSYIEETLPNFFVANNIISDNIFISQAYNVYNLELNCTASANTYIVFEDEDVIGLLSVDEHNGKFNSSFEYGNFSAIQKLYDDNENIAFVAYDEELYVENEVDIYDTDDITSDIELSTIEIELSTIDRNNHINNFFTNTYSSYYYRKNISVPIVANETCPFGHGLCWAATIASKYDYLSGNNIIAMDIYNELDAMYDEHPLGLPIWEERACNYLNMNYTYLDRMMDCGEILENIKVNNPISMSISRNGGAHAVLLCGITFFNDNSGIYRIMDSNKSTYVDIAVSEDTMNGDEQFTYATSYGYIYTNWFRSFY